MARAPVPPSVPPLWVNVPLIAELPPRARLPPEMTKLSSTVNWLAANTPDDTVMVCKPATLMFTF